MVFRSEKEQPSEKKLKAVAALKFKKQQAVIVEQPTDAAPNVGKEYVLLTGIHCIHVTIELPLCYASQLNILSCFSHMFY